MLNASRFANLGSHSRPWFIALVLILCSLLTTALKQSDAALTNDDVVKMVRAELATHIIRTTIESSNAKFDLTPAGLIALKEAGVSDDLIAVMQARMQELARGPKSEAEPRTAPEKSDLLSSSKDRDFILRNFKTMLVDASGADFFGTEQMKAALARNKGFATLGIAIVDDSAVADVVLKVNYTFAWDYPFSVRHQNTSLMLVSGKGKGPFSGPAGAASVASELVKLLKPYRVPRGK